MKPLRHVTASTEREYNAFDFETSSLQVRGARRRQLNFEAAPEPYCNVERTSAG